MPFIAQGMVLSRTAEMALRFNALPPAPNYLFWSSAAKPYFWSVWLEWGRAADKKKGSQAFYCLTPLVLLVSVSFTYPYTACRQCTHRHFLQ